MYMHSNVLACKKIWKNGRKKVSKFKSIYKILQEVIIIKHDLT